MATVFDYLRANGLLPQPVAAGAPSGPVLPGSASYPVLGPPYIPPQPSAPPGIDYSGGGSGVTANDINGQYGNVKIPMPMLDAANAQAIALHGAGAHSQPTLEGRYPAGDHWAWDQPWSPPSMVGADGSSPGSFTDSLNAAYAKMDDRYGQLHTNARDQMNKDSIQQDFNRTTGLRDDGMAPQNIPGGGQTATPLTRSLPFQLQLIYWLMQRNSNPYGGNLSYLSPLSAYDNGGMMAGDWRGEGWGGGPGTDANVRVGTANDVLRRRYEDAANGTAGNTIYADVQNQLRMQQLNSQLGRIAPPPTGGSSQATRK